MDAATWKGKIDLGIITIREDEFAAVLQKLPEKVDTAVGQRRYRIRQFRLSPTEAYTIAVFRCIEPGNGEALAAARDLIEDLAPSWLFVVGIAGGVPANEFSLGDVLVSTRIADFSVEAVLNDHSREYALAGGPLHREASKLAADIAAMVEDGELSGWSDEANIGLPQPLVDLAEDRFYADPSWNRDLQAKLTLRFVEQPSRPPLVRTGPIASSDRLIKDAETLQVWLKMARQVQAIEMESAGVYRATHGKDIPFLAIRGISDIVGFKRHQDWTAYACQSAAAFLVAFLRTRTLPPKKQDRRGSDAPVPEPDSSVVSLDEGDLARYRPFSTKWALNLADQKSRAIRPIGSLPELVPMRVRAQLLGERPRVQEDGRLSLNSGQSLEKTLYEAVNAARRTLILGDLGTGKSTLAANLVLEIHQRSGSSFAVVVPARYFADEGKDRPNSIRSLIDTFNSFICENLLFSSERFDLENFLNSDIESTLILDGLDEVNADNAAILLREFSRIADRWAKVRLVATTRPLLLSGVNYQDWQLLEPLPLSDEERLQILVSEAISQEQNPDDAAATANRILSKIRISPILNRLANSPLTVRLLFSRLLTETQNVSPATLGDLLYDLVQDRLGCWSEKEQRTKTCPDFEKHFPDADSRVELLAQLTLRMGTRTKITMQEAKRCLADIISQFRVHPTPSLVSESLQYFKLSGIVAIDDKNLEYQLQPIRQFLCGFGLPKTWEMSGSDPEWLGSQHWRVVSFSATALRKLGLLPHLRMHLLRWVRALMKVNQIWKIPAASYIIYESQDLECATVWVNELEGLEFRPLTLLSDDWYLSAQAIAESLHIAGLKGFDWLYNHYLDPKYPIIGAGSKIIDDVFAAWAEQAIDTVDESQLDRLRKVVSPNVAAENHLLISIIPWLALLVPKSFSLSDELWFMGKLLDRTHLNNKIITRFRTAFFIDRSTTNHILLEHVRRGYENAGSAAALWLELNSDTFPPADICKGILRACHRRIVGDHIRAAFAACQARVGLACWTRFLRWCLFDESAHGASLAAAIELHVQGEIRLSLLGPALLRASEGSDDAELAMRILCELTAEGGKNIVGWLTQHVVQQGRRRGFVARELWSLLLAALPTIGAEAPGALAWVIPLLDGIMLATSPGVRESFVRLLSNAAFRDTLRNCLQSPDPACRHGAAMALLTANPKEEPEALLSLVETEMVDRLGAQDVWLKFCLSLSFSESGLTLLRKQLDHLAPNARALALAILDRHSELTDVQHADLVRALLTSPGWWLDTHEADTSPVAVPKAFQVLLDVMLQGPQSSQATAANRLLTFHRARLTTDQMARCYCLEIQPQAFFGYRLAPIYEKFETQPDFAEYVFVASTALQTEGRAVPLLHTILKARRNPAEWEDVVWSLLCDDSRFHTLDDLGFWLLEIGLQSTDAASAIGTASMRYYDDSRVVASRRTSAREWIGLLAHEFGGLPSARLSDALMAERIGIGEVSSALLARLGAVPSGFKPRDGVGHPPRLSPKHVGPVPMDSRQALRDICRPSGILHPDVLEVCIAVVLDSSFTEEDLEPYTKQSIPSLLIALALRWCFGLPSRASDILHSLPALASPASNPQGNAMAWKVLTQICLTARTELVSASPGQTAYVHELRCAVLQRGMDVCQGAAELLRIRRSLEPDELIAALEIYVLTERCVADGFEEELAHWLSSELPRPLVAALPDILDRAIRTLDSSPWPSDNFTQSDALRYLLLSLAYWRFSDKSTVSSQRVFLRGWKILLGSTNRNRGSLFENYIHLIEGLLRAVPRTILREAVETGQHLGDPFWNVMAYLFAPPEMMAGEQSISCLSGLPTTTV